MPWTHRHMGTIHMDIHRDMWDLTRPSTSTHGLRDAQITRADTLTALHGYTLEHMAHTHTLPSPGVPSAGMQPRDQAFREWGDCSE